VRTGPETPRAEPLHLSSYRGSTTFYEVAFTYMSCMPGFRLCAAAVVTYRMSRIQIPHLSELQKAASLSTTCVELIVDHSTTSQHQTHRTHARKAPAARMLALITFLALTVAEAGSGEWTPTNPKFTYLVWPGVRQLLPRRLKAEAAAAR
jgi:DMSO reductase anchor subunit